MTGVDVRFRTASPITASYNWIDFVTQAGYVRFYGVGSTLTAGVTYLLTTTAVDSGTGDTSGTAGFKTFGVAGADIDIDFDITFNRPVTIAKADAFVNYTLWHEANADINSSVVSIKHVDTGASETVIGTASIEAHTQAPENYWREALKIALTETVFSIGEKLRITITVVNNAANNTAIFHDPTSSLSFTDSESRTIGSDMTIDIPFKVQT